MSQLTFGLAIPNQKSPQTDWRLLKSSESLAKMPNLTFLTRDWAVSLILLTRKILGFENH